MLRLSNIYSTQPIFPKRSLEILGLTLGLVATLAGPISAIVPPDGSSPVAAKAYRHPDLDFRVAHARPDELPSTHLAKAARARADLSTLGVEAHRARLDLRGGRWATLILAEPLLPGEGNDRRWPRAKPANHGELEQAAWEVFTSYLADHVVALRVSTSELSAQRRVTVHGDGELIQIHAPRTVGGVLVRSSYLTAVIRHGNLVLLGAHAWGDVDVSTVPGLSIE